MNSQNKNDNPSENLDKLNKVDESVIEKPNEVSQKDTENPIEGEINPTVTFYKEDKKDSLENIKVIELEDDIKEEEDIHNIERDFDKKPSRKKKIIIYLIVLLAIGSALLFYINSSKHKAAQKANTGVRSAAVVPVSVKKINRANFQVLEKTIGSISNLDINTVASEVSGVIERINVNIGDTVKAGDIVAVVDSNELRNNVISQESEIQRLSALLTDTKRTQSRYQKLIKDGFVSQAELDTLNTNIKSYQEQLVNARAVLANNKIRLAKSSIRASQSGMIQQRYVTRGTLVSNTSPIVDIVNNNNLMVIASMPESFSYRLKKDQKVELKVSGTDIVLKSSIKELKPVIDEQSRSVALIIYIPKNDYNLKPGGTLEVYISMELKKDAILVPESAVVLRIAGKVVYTLNEDGTVNEIPVKTGAYQDGLIEILSGLKGDETIVVDGASFLSDKAKVNVTNSAE
ncbi:MAG: efflux RND transporter periplasmic adaptor subunit [Alphaproteobacteria bacterium]|jgi:RND family efflux transporter MFP subunit|nr:efflux RND transporter periplasmic adaptor subunit [Alphaproteobacteria bacterium]